MSTEKDDGPRFFTTSEVASYCAVTNDGVLKWIKAGKMRAFTTPGGHYRVSTDDFRSFLDQYDIPVDEPFFNGDPAGHTIVVVDDDPTIRRIVRRYLEEVDSELIIEEASDCYDAGIKIGALQPDLVILDLMIPHLDGVALCKSIRRNRKTRSTKVLAITGSPDQEHASRVYEAGADLCLLKPLQFEHFRMEVTRMLESIASRNADA
jgi:two-component system OmpR family response regulator